MELKELKDSIDGLAGSVKGMAEENKSLREKLVGLESRFSVIESSTKNRVPSVTLPGVTDKEVRKFSFARVIRSLVRERAGDHRAWEGAEFERDIREEVRKKDLSAGVDSAGGYLVPEQFLDSEFIELLRAQTVVIESGARVMDGLSGAPVPIPRHTGGATGYWLGENGSPTKSQQAFGQLNLTPHRAGAFTKVSNRLINLSPMAVENIVREDLTAVIARLIDLAALRGSGASNEPTGIRNTTSVNEKDVGGTGAPTFEHLYDMMNEVEKDNVSITRGGFIMHPVIWNKYRKLRDLSGGAGTGQFMLAPNGEPLMAGVRAMFGGWPIRTTTQIPTNLGGGADRSEVYFGQWPDLLLGFWGGLEIRASDIAGDSSGSALLENQTWITISREVDVGVRHPEAFCFADDVLVT